jgi:hypothetical protein
MYFTQGAVMAALVAGLSICNRCNNVLEFTHVQELKYGVRNRMKAK